MKKNEVQVGGFYTAKVSDKLVKVRIESIHTGGGWNATNTATGKRIRIKSAQRLRGPVGRRGKKTEVSEAVEAAVARDVKAESAAASDEQAEARGKAETSKARPKKARGEQKPKRVSALNAAAQVLANAEQPMRAQELIAAMAKQGLWKSPAGKTPHATLYAAMLREARDKGTAARFRKVGRGQFAFNREAKS